jgi:rubrerythrin
MQDAQIHELELMARHEEAIAELYETYAEKFPDYKEFWERLAKEEASHANWIRDLHAKVENGAISFGHGRFNIKAIDRSLSYVKQWTTDAEGGWVEPLQAMSIAHDLENALIEKNYLDVREADTEEMKKLVSKLREATGEHRNRIAEALNEARKRPAPGTDVAMG